MSCRNLSLSLMILFLWKGENGGNNISTVKGFSLSSSLSSSHRSSSFFQLSSSSTSSTSKEHNTISDVTDLGRDKLQQYFSFPIDDWQALAGGEIYSGRNAIVCAPTGAGKTVVSTKLIYSSSHSIFKKYEQTKIIIYFDEIIKNIHFMSVCIYNNS